MGAQQSADKRKKAEEKNEQMIKGILEQQRIMYEKKCNNLLKNQKKALVVVAKEAISLQTRSTPQNHNADTPRLTNGNAQLYPNLIDFPDVYGQPSTSRASYMMSSVNNNHMHSVANATAMTLQNKAPSHTAFNCHPTAPSVTSNEVYVSRTTYNGSQPSAPTASNNNRASGSRSSVNARNNQVVDWKCITCKKHSNTKKIFQCNQGHSSCMTCKFQGARCGTCRNPITDIRNITLESFIDENESNMASQTMTTVDCPNISDGCRLAIKPSNINAHVKECPFREMTCPTTFLHGSCPWRGKINQLQSHFLDCHPDKTGTADVDTEMTLNYITTKYYIHLVVMGNFRFLVYLKIEPTAMYMAVQLVGTRVSASKWIYELHVYNKSEPRRKYTYVDKCRPTMDAVINMCNEFRGAAVPLQYAKTFCTDDTLTYKFYIKKINKNKPKV